jgi:cytochrome c
MRPRAIMRFPSRGRACASLLPPAGEGSGAPAPTDEGRRAAIVLAVFCVMAGAAGHAWAGGLAGDPDRGEKLYEACQDCHSLDKNDVGPRHRGVFGRKAGSLPDYRYSDALKSSTFVWNEDTLDKWLTDPQTFVPGVKMFFHLDSAQDRADVIAYLRERAK